jgi:type I restriction enzyme M protein
MNADDFRDYMLAFLFLRYLSDNYEVAAKKELGSGLSLSRWTVRSTRRWPFGMKATNDVPEFEKQMRRKVHYCDPAALPVEQHRRAGAHAETANCCTLQAGFKYIENESFASTFQGLFSEINLGSDKLGKTYAERNAKLCTIIPKIAEGHGPSSPPTCDTLGDAYEYLIGQFAAGSGKKAGEFYTPQQISTSSRHRHAGQPGAQDGPKRSQLDSVLDFACGSGSLLLNVRHRMGPHGIGKIYGQEKNITTYNLARMNMLLHGVKDTEFEIFHGDTLTNDWDILRELNPAKKPNLTPSSPTHRSATAGSPPTRWARTCASRTMAWRPSPPRTLPSCCTVSTS